METFFALLAICAGNWPVPGEFPAEMTVTRSFDVFFDLRLNKRLSKQSWGSGWWFETLSRPLWRHCNVLVQLSSLVWEGPKTSMLIWYIFPPFQEHSVSDMLKVKVPLDRNVRFKTSHMIDNASEDDEGTYFCKVRNDLGTDERQAELTLMSKYHSHVIIIVT